MTMSGDNTHNTEAFDNKVRCISKAIQTRLSPTEIFQGLNHQDQLSNAILLESSEIESKNNLSSILMLKASVRIVCQKNVVRLVATNQNGINALQQIKQAVLSSNKLDIAQQHTAETLEITIRQNDQSQDEYARLSAATPLEVLRLIHQLFEVDSGNLYGNFLCGVFAFDFIASYEKLPEVENGQNTCPDYVFYLAETLLVFDHTRQTQRLYSNCFPASGSTQTYHDLARELESLEQRIHQLSQNPLSNTDLSLANQNKIHPEFPVSVDINDNEYIHQVNQLKQNIIDGDVFQVVPSRTFTIDCQDPLHSYSILKYTNPSPYLFYLRDQDFTLFGASPETALKYEAKNRQVQLYPIAGTSVRGKNSNGEINPDLDGKLEAELKLNEKEIAEHMMLVDLARNDIAKISMPGTTRATKLLSVDRYSQVMHLVSQVQGRLRDELDAFHAYQSCMNMGTLTGAPKIRATELIREMEGKRRGSYGGAVGYINSLGDMDTCIVIRSAFCQNGKAHVQAGAGIVYDSDPQSEAQETSNK
ncbi:MAG: anthranilate synthase component 1, partial [Gammaproteobacteria bacterium]|nr:anthranilate synthase component 1 [Gammaproteobacteria bacterium]